MSPNNLLKKLRKTQFGRAFSAHFFSFGIKALNRSLRVRWVDRRPIDELYAKGQRFIYAYWHADLILATHIGATELKHGPIVVMASLSRDGYLLAELMARDGLTIVRASSRRGGMEGFMAFARHLRSGMIGSIAVDGPRGPRRVVKNGVIRLAQMTGTPILPCAVGYRRKITLNSWDRLRIPVPFSSATVICDSPIFVDSEMTREKADAAAEDLGSVLTKLRERLPYDRE